MKTGKLVLIRWTLLFTSLVFIMFGVIREEPKTVLKKAVNICLECIGIG